MRKKQKSEDREVLEMAWRLGDWQTIAGFPVSDEDFHSSLLVVLAKLHMEKDKASLESLQIPSELLERSDANYVLASLYDTLGKAHLIRNDVETATEHFEDAAKIALKDIDLPSAITVRIQNQIHDVESLTKNSTAPGGLCFNLSDSLEPSNFIDIIGANYVLEKGSSLWIENHQSHLSCSDMPVAEKRIADILASVTDKSIFSGELVAHQTDWESEYNFSVDRTNILRPFASILEKCSVLELGCGCGVLTRYLGETVSNVVAVEDNYHRALITANRTDDLENVHVIHRDLHNLPFENHFDVVTLIGGLELLRNPENAEDSVQYLMQSARRYLKPGGVLLLATQNQLGLKNFAGVQGDHPLGAMAGIQDLYYEHSPLTFGKSELERCFSQAGFNDIEPHLPFPDYKFPCVMVHPEGYQTSHLWQLDTLLSTTVFHDRQGILSPNFSLESVWPIICRNNLVQDMANSYLFLAFNGPKKNLFPPTQLASYFSPKRSRDAHQELVFFRDEYSKIKIKRTRFDTESCQFVSDIESYISGQNHSVTLDKILQKVGWTVDELTHWLQIWIDALLVHQVEPQNMPVDWPTYEVYLPANFIDAVPRNLITSDSGYSEFIDLEWSIEHTCPLSLVLYRGLIVTLGCVTSTSMPAAPETVNRNVLIDKLLKCVGIALTDEQKSSFAGVMYHLESKATGNKPGHPLGCIPDLGIFNVRTNHNKTPTKYELCCYWRRVGKEFSEETASKVLCEADGCMREYAMPILTNGVLSGLRLDISAIRGFFIIHELRIEDINKEVVWQLNMKRPQVTRIADFEYFVSEAWGGLYCISAGVIPQFILDMTESELQHLGHNGSIVIKIQAYI